MGDLADDDTKSPQDQLNDFWDNLITKRPAKVTNIFPPTLYVNLLPTKDKNKISKGKNAAETYSAAAEDCRARVKRIVRECRRTNEKYTDPDFDIEGDLDEKNCLEGLKHWYNSSSGQTSNVSPDQLSEAFSTLTACGLFPPGSSINMDIDAVTKVLDYRSSTGSTGPGSVHRIDWIFDKPSFTVDGFSSSDVRQGANGDCWFIAAVSALCINPDLMNQICVVRDEECGVYGFVFYRDGEWIWTVVDDNLYVRYKDFDAYGDYWDPDSSKQRKWKKDNQTGSDALYFAQCQDQNETWLPLLEKAYAKVHGDYKSIAGGWSGEAIEDLTGGVTTKIPTNRVLNKDTLWNELVKANKDFIFSASSPGSYGDDTSARQGLALNHAYSVIKAVEEEDEEGKKFRLVLIRNPWGKKVNASMGEWNGPWSDGSSQWNPYWMKKLNHRFGDDGLFWMSYDDLRSRFEVIDRTRLFNKDWTVVQQWTSVSVAWVTGYLNTKFSVEIKKGGPTVFVLCQLDDRYFVGLEGKYIFDLHFILQEANSAPGDYIVRARGPWFGNRSISAEVDLEPGTYEVVPKIVAERNADAPDVYDIVTKVADRNPQKLRQIGMNYDIANSKGIAEISEEEKKRLEERKKAAEEKKKKEEEELQEKAEFEVWKKEKKERQEKIKSEEEKIKKEGGLTKAHEKEEDELTKKDEHSKKEEEKKADEHSKEEEEKKTDESTKKAEKKKTDELNKEDDEKTTTETIKKDEGKSTDHNEKEDAPELKERSSAPGGPMLDANEGVDGDGSTPSDNNKKSEDSKQKPWNAVCVLGLRVYTQATEASIKLVKPRDPEEGANLDVDGTTTAGATM